MLTAYHLDDDKLVLTHDCMAGNETHMVAEKFDAASGVLTFAFAGGANIGATAGTCGPTNCRPRLPLSMRRQKPLRRSSSAIRFCTLREREQTLLGTGHKTGEVQNGA
jgi:hypothetical protein